MGISVLRVATVATFQCFAWCLTAKSMRWPHYCSGCRYRTVSSDTQALGRPGLRFFASGGGVAGWNIARHSQISTNQKWVVVVCLAQLAGKNRLPYRVQRIGWRGRVLPWVTFLRDAKGEPHASRHTCLLAASGQPRTRLLTPTRRGE